MSTCVIQFLLSENDTLAAEGSLTHRAFMIMESKHHAGSLKNFKGQFLPKFLPHFSFFI